MPSSHDDLDAIKTLIETLTPFEQSDQERIIRWACEKLGISIVPPASNTPPKQLPPSGITGHSSVVPTILPPGTKTDIKSFVNSKKPANDMQFSTTVAYFYTFEAPEAQRKESIGSEDLQDACRQLGRERLQNPGQTLRNACYNGLLDKASDRGSFKINTVGENLVAVTLPSESAVSPSAKKKVPRKSASKKSKGKKKVTNKKR